MEIHHDLAIACKDRASQCRQMIRELKQPNDKLRHGGENQ